MRTFRAPGRVNLIGEHTDYNDGFVMPVAVDFATSISATPRDDRIVSAYSHAFGERVEFSLDAATGPRCKWSDYLEGVARMLERAGFELDGADLDIRSNVPLGAGLSSSAALEVSGALALLSGQAIDRLTLARLCQQAEVEFVGLRCGIMDQFVSLFGKANHALMLDCRTLEYELLPLPAGVRLVICNTMVRHELASSEYNDRREACEQGAKEGGVPALRDLESVDGISPPVRGFCRHVISENARVLEAAEALRRGDLKSLGQLMAQSHSSLRHDYRVSCPELDLMVELANRVPGVYGARMTGGGFGGCTINLVAAESVGQFVAAIGPRYERATGKKPAIYVTDAVNGAAEVFHK